MINKAIVSCITWNNDDLAENDSLPANMTLAINNTFYTCRPALRPILMKELIELVVGYKPKTICVTFVDDHGNTFSENDESF